MAGYFRRAAQRTTGLLPRQSLRIALGFCVVLVLGLHSARQIELQFLDQIEALLYDVRIRWTMPATVDDRIVIIDLDERSLGVEGRWPWGRDKMAQLTARLLEDYGASVVGFDVVFAEADRSSGLASLRALEKTRLKGISEFGRALDDLVVELDYDARFARKLASGKTVLGYYFTGADESGARYRSGTLPEPIFAGEALDRRDNAFVHAAGYGANLAEFQAAAWATGHFNPAYDLDGVSRRVPLLIRYNGDGYEAFSLAVARAYLGVLRVIADPPATRDGYSTIESLRIGKIRIPVDENVTALVPYRGKKGSFRYISATDVLHGRFPKGALQGKIALVGTSAPGLLDLRSTPVSNVFPGVEINANMIAGILDQNIKHRPAYLMGMEVITVLLLGILLSIVLPLVGPIRAAAIAAAIAAAVVIGNLTAWQYFNVVLPIASTLLLIGLIFGINSSYGFFVETRAKRTMTRRFGQYVPPELVDELSRHPDSWTMEGESRTMTILFSDIRDFTRLSEGLDPKELSQMMNEYLTAMTQIIHRHRGTIDKYIGDAIMAFWGAPLPDRDHARNALAAAMEMQASLPELNRRFSDRGWPALRVGIGINTGTVSVGNMGSDFRRAYTVMGDAVNLASRLEGLGKEYGAPIIVGEATHAEVPEVVYRELDRVCVKGKAEPVTIFEALAPHAIRQYLDLEQLHLSMLDAYRSQDWPAMERALDALLAAEPDSILYQVYRSRLDYFRDNPPAQDWDGVFTYLTK